MPTPAKFSKRKILDSALRVVARAGPSGTSVAAVAAEVGAPTGSIYHRFPSKDVLLGELWLETVEELQHGFLEALEIEDIYEAGRSAALWTPRWVRQNPARARLLLLHRREDFLGRGWPDAMVDQARAVGAEVEGGVRSFARRVYGAANRDALRRVRFALVDVPYAATRRYVVAGKKPPATVDDLICTTLEAVVMASARRRATKGGS